MAKTKLVEYDVDRHLSTAELAELIGVSVQRVGQLCKEGVLEKAADGKFALRHNVAMYLRYVAIGW